MSFLIKHIRNNLFFLCILPLFIALFFYHLDYNTLNSWDEAWYGSIAKNIVKTGDYVNLTFNGEPFYDHPPMGFWIMSVSYKIFGVNEFATRMPSALAGLGSVVLIFLIGALVFHNKAIGFVATIIFSTCVWFLIRARSGNLDAIFLFFYTLTVYLAYKSRDNFNLFPFLGLAFGSLIMSKTLVGISALPVILWILFLKKNFKLQNIIYLFLGIIAFVVVVYPWYSAQFAKFSDFYERHFVHIGMRDTESTLNSLFKLNWQLPMFYLHMGVRKWYYLWLISFGIVLLHFMFLKIKILNQFFRKKPITDYLRFNGIGGLILWNLVILIPFLTTDKTEIWHLIPVYAPLSLILAFGAFILFDFFKNLLKKTFIQRITSAKWFIGLYTIPFIFIAIVQFNIFSNEVFPISKYKTDEVDILIKTKPLNTKVIYIDRDFVPIAVFYSDHLVKEHTRESDDILTVQKVFDNDRNVILVIKNSTVDNFIKSGAKVSLISKNSSFSIISQSKAL